MVSNNPAFKIHGALKRSGLLVYADKTLPYYPVSKTPGNKVDYRNGGNQVQKLLESLDWKHDRNKIARFTVELMPFEELVPEVYAAWRPVVRETLYYLAENLPPQRLIPKLVQEISHPNRSLEQRFIRFITSMPTLQKLGQVIARNRNLDPQFREQLIQLENSIRDVSAKDIHQAINQSLAKKLKTYNVKIADIIHSEASVSAVTRFTWTNPASGLEENGVFKVQKPGIAALFKSEMQLLSGLAQHLKKKTAKHILAEVNLETTFSDIRNHLESELDSKREQANLLLAKKRLKMSSHVRIPTLIEELSTPTITAMSFEAGKKVTEAFQENTSRRNDLAVRIFETMVANPLYSSEDKAIFHADPHAGNLLVNESTHNLVILDWSLTEELSLSDRKKLVMLVSALFLQDEHLIFHVINELRVENTTYSDECMETIYRIIQEYLEGLPIIHLPKLKQILTLLDDVAAAGVQFSAGLLIFRKVLLTLDGLLKDLSDQLPLESIIAYFAFKEWVRHTWGLTIEELINKPTNLSASESFKLLQSAQWFGLRTGLQTISRLSSKN